MEPKLCKCSKPARSGQRNCKNCHAEYMRKNRKPLEGEARKKANARSYLHVYVKRGKVKKEPCRVCFSETNLNAHHEDYSKPLEVLWLCRKCHLQHHKKPI